MNISYLICAAGEGSRLKSISNSIPKAFLKINGKTLIEYSLESLDLDPEDEIIIIHRMSPDEQTYLKKITKRFGTNQKLVGLNQLTRGQAETALMAKSSASQKSIAIFNSDTFYQAKEFKTMAKSGQWDGVIPCFKASGESWSFCKTQSEQSLEVSEVAEKKRISDWASAGMYFFKEGAWFFEQVEKIIAEKKMNSEFYVAPIYNDLIQEQKKVCVVSCEQFKPMGTIEQVETFWNLNPADFKKQNQTT